MAIKLIYFKQNREHISQLQFILTSERSTIKSGILQHSWELGGGRVKKKKVKNKQPYDKTEHIPDFYTNGENTSMENIISSILIFSYKPMIW